MVKPDGKSTTNSSSFLLMITPLHLLLVSVQNTNVLLAIFLGLGLVDLFLLFVWVMIPPVYGGIMMNVKIIQKPLAFYVQVQDS